MKQWYYCMNDDFLTELRKIFSEKQIAEAAVWSEIVYQITICRETLGMTQKELACRVGVSKRKINRIENCNYNPKLSLICKIFGVLWEKKNEK